MKTKIFNLIILDESGSMQSIKRAAIDSVNEYNHCSYMKRYMFLVVCMTTLLFGHTSCERVVDTDAMRITADSLFQRQRFDALVEQVRMGNTEACRSLAECYSRGEGVEQSLINATIMYFIYEERSECSLDSIISCYPKDSSFRVWYEVIDAAFPEDSEDEALVRFNHCHPLEGKAIEACIRGYGGEACLPALYELECEGSELAVLFQIMIYEDHDDSQALEQCMERSYLRFPALASRLANIYVKRYGVTQDTTYIVRAAECFRYADAHGMLYSHFIDDLITLYDNWSEQGVLTWTDEERARLMRLKSLDFER